MGAILKVLASLSTQHFGRPSRPRCPGGKQAAPEGVSTLSLKACKLRQLAEEALVAQKFSEGKAQGSGLLKEQGRWGGLHLGLWPREGSHL